ncbi:MAG TPA: PAS domain S-box protein, partial [Urbifossiella sp.]|nr:PAS domain S-box protein [Urbifossiella sp.]
DANRQACESLGYARDELIGLGFADIDPDAARDKVETVRRELAAGRVVTLDTRHRRKDGTTFPVEVRLGPFEVDGRLSVLALARDVTERKRAEEALRAARAAAERGLARLRAVVSTMADGLIVAAPDGQVVDANPAALRLLGFAAPADLSRPLADLASAFALSTPDGGPVAAADWPLARALRGETVADAELGLRRLDTGREWRLVLTAAPVWGPDGRVELAVLGLHDVTDRRRSEVMLGAVMRSVLDAVVTIDERGVVRAANPATERLFGHPAGELIGRGVSALMPEPHRSRFGAYLGDFVRTGAGRVVGGTLEVEAARRDGTTFPAEVTVTEFRLDGARQFTGVVRDLTERKRLEEQFRQAQKMEAVGRLAGGVAHDFNNLLTVINGHTELLLGGSRSGESATAALAAVRDAGERAARLTGQLLAFSRKAIIEPKVLAPNDVVGRAVGLLRRLIGEDVTLVTEFDPAAGRIKADPGQIEQVLMNLVVNARDAMPRGGRLTVATRAAELRADDPGRAPDCRPGRYVVLEVADTGCGMTDEVKARIFEPFFTTKGVGQGTGLGLAMVYGVAKTYGGHVGVESRVGAGSVFRVVLPAEAGGGEPPAPAAPPPPPRGAETVLLVEDDAMVRGLAKLSLQRQGYTVLAAAGGAEAARAAAAHPGPVHLLVTDVVMPGAGGREVADDLHQRHPGLKVLFVSGYTDDAVLRHGVVRGAAAFLGKPFTPQALARKVREVLDET